jgi:hypothetical protein
MPTPSAGDITFFGTIPEAGSSIATQVCGSVLILVIRGFPADPSLTGSTVEPPARAGPCPR